MERYKKYKDSGIEWIGEIPEHWEILKVKNLAKLQGGYAFKSENFGTAGEPIIRIGDISDHISWDHCKKADCLQIPEDFQIRKGDTLIALSGATTGKTCFVKNDPPHAFINQRVAKVNYPDKFLFYIINSAFFQEQIYLSALGSAQENISNFQIENIFIPVVKERPEQLTIANYLDRKTAEIDDLIAKKKRLLELYEEEKIAIINHAVTKGINPDAPMKDSGIEWLGEIPEKWEVKKLKYVVNMRSGNNITSERIKEEGEFPVYGGNGIRGYYNKYTHEGIHVLIGRQGALCGNINYADGKFWASEHAVVCQSVIKHNIFWIGELLKTMNLNQYSVSAAQPGLSVEKIKNLEAPFPSISEQNEIASFLIEKLNEYDVTVQKTKALVGLLSEYRTALISEVVTGKVKVVE